MFSTITFEQLLALRPRDKVGLASSTFVMLVLALWVLDSPHTSVDWFRSLRNHFGVSIPSLLIIVASLLFALVEFAQDCISGFLPNGSFERLRSSMYDRSVATKRG
jgi:hypothetical protein